MAKKVIFSSPAQVTIKTVTIGKPWVLCTPKFDYGCWGQETSIISGETIF